YRHAEPSGPWPWVDFNHLHHQELPIVPPTPSAEDLLVDRPPIPAEETEKWMNYPKSLFGNWQEDQVRLSGMMENCPNTRACCTYRVDVEENGDFRGRQYNEDEHDDDYTWRLIQKPRPENLRVRVLLVDNLTQKVMKMLGTQYNIEPFFFSSSVNWIPSQYQEDYKEKQGDHITIILPFMRAIGKDSCGKGFLPDGMWHPIDTHAPLPLRSTGYELLTDLLAIHMVRTAPPNSSTILSYHHPHNASESTSAQLLYSLVLRARKSVYWGKIFDASKDPTFVLVAILWYALYAWDEALEKMYEHIGSLESDAIHNTDEQITVELHFLQAHLLHYVSLLEEFKHSVVFVRDTPNPAMESDAYNSDQRKVSQDLMNRECDNLLFGITRLERRRKMFSDRLKNAIDLAFAKVNIEESKEMRKLTEAAVRDSEAMKQISYLTIIFLPASFLAGVFGMNVMEINPGTTETMLRYIEVSIAFTLLTIWLVIAVQPKNPVHGDGDMEGKGFLTRRLWWPYFWLMGQTTAVAQKVQGWADARKHSRSSALRRGSDYSSLPLASRELGHSFVLVGSFSFFSCGIYESRGINYSTMLDHQARIRSYTCSHCTHNLVFTSAPLIGFSRVTWAPDLCRCLS
ncbi:hypothetical protein BJ138DRAFT_997584, partial [Hygrophoropsis aurantiaca]